jgi:hypothetical protein
MTTRSFSGVIMAVAVVLVLSVASAQAQTTSAEFDQATQTIKVSISGGSATTYTVHVRGSGCIDTLPQTVNLDGPADEGSVSIACVGGASSGQAEIAFCIGELCFDTKYIQLICSPECVISEAGRVPALGEWGLFVLILLIAASAVWMIRKRRIPAR